MAKKRKTEASLSTEVDTEGSSGAVYSAPGEASGFADAGMGGEFSGSGPGSKPKLAIPLMENGRIDLDSMRAATRSKLETAIKATPGLLAQVGEPLSEKDCEYLYSLLGQVETFIATRFLGIPPELAGQLMYSPQDIRDLTGPTQEVAAKYGLTAMPPEVKLAMALIAINTRKVLDIKMQMAQQASRRAALTAMPRPEATMQ